MQLVRQFLAGRLSIDRINALAVAGYGGHPPAELLDTVRVHLQPRGLGITRAIAADRLRAALDFARHAPRVRGASRARGVRLVAMDLDWSRGRGSEVRGSGEALLMAMAGRRAALDELTGPGQSRFARQISSPSRRRAGRRTRRCRRVSRTPRGR